MRRKITKAKIKKRSLEVELTETIETNNGPVTNEITMKCAGIVHDDLIERFNRLALHMILICDLKLSDRITPDTFQDDDLEDYQEYSVSGFSTAGEDEGEGLVLIGSRKLKNGKHLNITTPFTKYSDSQYPYAYEEELYNDVQACIYEVEKYLWEGKFAVKQLDIGFDEEDVEKADLEVA